MTTTFVVCKRTHRLIASLFTLFNTATVAGPRVSQWQQSILRPNLHENEKCQRNGRFQRLSFHLPTVPWFDPLFLFFFFFFFLLLLLLLLLPYFADAGGTFALVGKSCSYFPYFHLSPNTFVLFKVLIDSLTYLYFSGTFH